MLSKASIKCMCIIKHWINGMSLIFCLKALRFEIQDLNVKPIMPELVCLSEAYIQIYEKVIDQPEITAIHIIEPKVLEETKTTASGEKKKNP